MHDSHPSYEKAAAPGKKVVLTYYFVPCIEHEHYSSFPGILTVLVLTAYAIQFRQCSSFSTRRRAGGCSAPAWAPARAWSTGPGSSARPSAPPTPPGQAGDRANIICVHKYFQCGHLDAEEQHPPPVEEECLTQACVHEVDRHL